MLTPPSRSPRPAVHLALAVILSLVMWPVSTVRAAPTVITDVTLVDGPSELQVTVAASGPVRYHSVDLNPRWIVVDVEGAQLGMSGPPPPIRRGPIQNVRVSQHAPGVVRIILALRQPTKYRLSASSDGNAVVIGIPVVGQAGPTPPPSGGPQGAPGSPGPARSVTLKVRDMELIDVLQALARLAHANIVTDPNVRGRVTVQLSGVTLEEALRFILEPNDLGYMTVGNTIIVGRKEKVVLPVIRRYALVNIAAKDLVNTILPVTGIKKEQVSVDDSNNAIFINATETDHAKIAGLIAQVDLPSEQTTTRVIALNYIEAALFLDLLGSRLPDTVVKTAKVNKPANSVVVTATAAQMQVVDALQTQVDTPAPQVMIEASVAEVPSEVVSNLGLAWQTATTFTINSTGTDATTGRLAISASAPAIVTVLNTLFQENKARLLANPRIAVRDGETARLQVGDKIPFQIINAQGVPSIVILDAGVKLEITPRVNKDGFITMRMHPEVSQIATAPAPGVPPTISTREADSSLTVKDGTPVILAGLIQKNETRTTVKVPLLGDIPVLGWLFKTESTDTRNNEVVFVITPHILAKIG
jgi:type II secretory pathway component GspD/PulD (secretin)